MLLFLQVKLLLFILLTPEIYVKGCGSGWFGEFCMFKCRCEDFLPCDFKGTCPGNCASGYFGLACQYFDIMTTNHVSATESYLRDGDHNTCNKNPSATSVKVLISRLYTFTFFRIYTTNNTNHLNFTTKLNGNKPCDNERKFRDREFVDVTCDNHYGINSVVFEGQIARHVCTIVFSLGRQVGLKQAATQSSNSATNSELAVALNAVDGNTSSRLLDGLCTSTKEELNNWWALKFNRPMIVTFIRIHNTDEFKQRLKGMTVECFSENGNRNFKWTDSESEPSDLYTITIESRNFTSSINISGSKTHVGNDRVMSLCEVEVFGEVVCPDGKHGLWCNKKCECPEYSACNAVTGACAKGCNPGFYGINCSSQCEKGCAGGLCGYQYGQCHSCIAGYQGIFCDKVCNDGFYGEGCFNTCSEHCLNVCDRVTGNCSCKENYKGPQCKASEEFSECDPRKSGKQCKSNCPDTCDENGCNKMDGTCISCSVNRVGNFCEICSDGFYGPDCRDTCPVHCTDICNHETGICTCELNYGGPLCAECADKVYGKLCEFLCSDFCINGSCNKITGECPVCVSGYKGPQCDIQSAAYTETATEIAFKYLMILPLIIGIVIAFSVSLLFCIEKKDDDENIEMSE